MSKRLAQPESRVCEDCSTSFTTNWSQRLCNRCRYDHAARSTCETCGRKTGQTGRRQCGLCRYGTPPDLRVMSPEERAWLTGIVEGEGTFGRAGRLGGQVRVVMTDQDVIQRLQLVTGLGLVHNRGRRSAHHKIAWEWAVTRRENVRSLAEELSPFLLRRRRESLQFIFDTAGRVMPSAEELPTKSLESWAWAAGLIEGEGWIGPSPKAGRKSSIVAVESTDQDVIERLVAATSYGHITSLGQRTSCSKPNWRWSVYSHADVHVVLTAILPLLGNRRANRANYVLNWIAERSRFEPTRTFIPPAFRASAIDH
jgi:hypothetical protein